MTASYINHLDERFFIIDDYISHGFGIQIDKKEATGEYYGKLYDSCEPYKLIKIVINKDIESLKSIIEDRIYRLIDDEQRQGEYDNYSRAKKV